LPKHAVKHVVLCAMGDQLGLLKGALVNYVVRNVKKMVPAYDLPGAVRFNEAIAQGTRGALKKMDIKPDDIALLQYTGGTTGVSKGAVLLHRNIIANVLQSEAWNAPVMNIGARRRTAHGRVRAAAVPHLRVHREHDAVHAHRRQDHPDSQPARSARSVEGAVQAHLPQLPGRQHAVQRSGQSS
jgi:acyl-CoA synthetase (AMP-forming)/AMP-acid ligase II